jgi:hypothetical protein
MEKENLYIFNFSKFIIVLFLIFSLFGFSFNYLFEKKIILKSEISGAYKINRILTSNIENEIPVFGSSRAEGSYIPSIITENPCFNYGVSGTKVNIWLFFLEEELKKNKSTNIIINLDLNGLLSDDGNINNYLPNYLDVKHVLNSEGNILYNIPFIKYFGQFESYIKYYMNNKLNLTKITENGGSFEKNVLTNSKFEELVNKRKKTSSKFNFDQVLFNKLNKLIKSTDRKIVFVIAPYHSSFLESYQGIEETNFFLSQLNNNKNVTVLDLKDYLVKDFMFINTTHVNYEGAKRFSEKLKKMFNDKIIMKEGYGAYKK